MANVTRTRPVEDIDRLISNLVATGAELLKSKPTLPADLTDYRHAYLNWDERSSSVLQLCFETSGLFTNGPVNEYKAVGLSLLDLRMNMTTLPLERFSEVETDVREKIRVLESIRGRLDLFDGPNPSAPNQPSDTASIFLVHGHDMQRRERVRRYLEKITKTPVIVLEDQPNQGRDVLGKLLDNAAQAAFAVILMTPDDEGRPIGSQTLRPRARQNVIFELGLFLGILGRHRVVALYDEGVEMPSDYSGVMWIPISGERWMLELASEMKAAGIVVSLDGAI